LTKGRKQAIKNVEKQPRQKIENKKCPTGTSSKGQRKEKGRKGISTKNKNEIRKKTSTKDKNIESKCRKITSTKVQKRKFQKKNLEKRLKNSKRKCRKRSRQKIIKY